MGKLSKIWDDRGNIVVEYDYYVDPEVRLKTEFFYKNNGEFTPTVLESKRDYTYGTNATYGTKTVTVVSTDLTGRSPTKTVVYHYHSTLQNLVRVHETIGANTNVTTMEYNDAATNNPANPYLLTRRTYPFPNLKTEEFQYNPRGNLEKYKDKLGRITEIWHSAVDDDLVVQIRFPSVTIPDPLNPGQFTTANYVNNFAYDAKNNLRSITDALGRTTHFRIRNGVDAPEADGQVFKIIDRRWNGSPATENDFTTVMTYYPDGNLESIQSPIGPSPHPGTKITFQYDNFDNVTRITDQLGNEWKTVYDALDRVIEEEDARAKSTYFQFTDGLLTSVNAPPNLGPSGIQSMDIGKPKEARKTQMSYDYRGRLNKVESHTSPSTLQTRVQLEHTGFSAIHKLIRLVNGFNKVTQWNYDALGRVIEVIDDLGRSSTRAYQPYCTEFTQTTARGIISTRTSDDLCRPQLLTTASEELEYFYDELGRLTKVKQNEDTLYSDGTNPSVVGRRVGVARWAESNQEWTFAYDPLDRMTRSQNPAGEVSLYSYGHEGELLQMTDPDGKITKYEYHNDLTLKKVIIERNSATVASFTYSYDAGGRLASVICSDGLEARFDTGGSSPQSGWNANGQLTHLRWVRGAQFVRSYAYSYDDSGNRIECVESNGTPAQDITWQYRYDWFDRLVQVKKGVGAATPTVEREYVFDESDNRTYLDDYLANKTFWYIYKTVVTGPDTKASDELLEIRVATGTGKRNPANAADFTLLESFVHDNDGNMVSRTKAGQTTNYEWDAFNNLLAVKQPGNLTQNLYDAGSIRKEMVKSSGERVKSFYAGMSTVSETSTTNGNTSYLMGHQLLGFEQNGNRFYFVTDGLTSVRAVLNSAGTEVASFSSDEFGIPTSAVGTSPKTYVGGLGVHNDIPDTGLYYMRRRHYDCGIGRFISKDPIGFAGGLNLYNYPQSPVNNGDPSGLKPLDTFDGQFRSAGARQEFKGDLIMARDLVRKFGTGPTLPHIPLEKIYDFSSSWRLSGKSGKSGYWGATDPLNGNVYINSKALSDFSRPERLVMLTATLANETYDFRHRGVNDQGSWGCEKVTLQNFRNDLDKQLASMEKALMKKGLDPEDWPDSYWNTSSIRGYVNNMINHGTITPPFNFEEIR